MHKRNTRQQIQALRDKGRRMALARWSAHRERMAAEQPDRVRELAIHHVRNLPRREGDMLGLLQWTDARTGRVRRWVMRIGDRADRVTLEVPGGKPTGSHGWTWIFARLREKMVGKSKI